MTRPRFAFLIKLSLLVFARVTVAVDEPPRPAQTSGEVYAEELKDLKIRQQAETVDLLVGKTNPRFVWNGGDMLWVEHNEAGKPGFAMNRAYELRSKRGPSTFYLFEANPGYLCRQNVEYTRCIEWKPTIIARHPTLGVVYDAFWPSAPLDGKGRVEMGRHIFLLCDGEHRWRLLGEGPQICMHDRLGPSEHVHQDLESKAAWNPNATIPVEISSTVVTTWEAPMSPEMENDPEWQALEIRRDLMMDARGKLSWTSDEYVVAKREESLESFSTRVAHWCTYTLVLADRDAKKKRAIREAVEQSLLRQNHDLPRWLPIGRKVALPKNLHEIKG